MSEKRRYRPVKNGNKGVKWFGFTLTPTSAQLLFIGSVVGIGLCILGLISITLNLITLMSAYSATEGASGMSGFTGAYSSILVNYLVIIIGILLLLAIAIYTLNKTKQMRG